ncbi:MAG: hypothetical protein ACE5HX_06740 [bacterium]
MFKSKKRLKQFVLAKSVKNTTYGHFKLNYKKNIEKALIISLFVIIFGFRLAAKINFERYLVKEHKVVFEFVDIPEIPPLLEPPKIKMEEVVERPMEEEAVSGENPLQEEIEELLGEKEENIELSLNSSNNDAYLISSSSLGSVAGPELNIRYKHDLDNERLSFSKGKFHGDLNDNGSLDIGHVERNKRALVSDEVSFEIKAGPLSLIKTNESESPNNGEITLGISGMPEKILYFTSSTIGTEDYKLWNKINSELDRLNKGRYGTVPKEIKRIRGGFIINFRFADDINQEIHWRNDGNVWIKVIGHSNKTSVQELRRALQGLLKLTLGN